MSKCICQNGKFDEMKDKRRTKMPKKKKRKMNKNVRVKHGLMKDVN